MYLIEAFLPTTNSAGIRFEQAMFDEVQDQLLDKFGGVTVFARAPAKGKTVEHGADEIIVVEVMSDLLQQSWWSTYRRHLEDLFAQDEILIRATPITRL